MARRKVERETPEVVAAVARMVRAVGKRVGREDPIDLQELARLRQALAEAEALAVAGLREQGCSWADIADGLGITRQAAHQRFNRKEVSK